MSAVADTLESGHGRSTERPSPLSLLLNNRLAAFGLAVLTLVILVALAAPILPLADPNATDPAGRLAGPLSNGHLLGTDALGRDMLSRLIWGTRVSLAVGLSASLIAAVLGSAIGLVAGYAGGRTDQILMRVIDLMMAFPYILLALAIVAILGPGLVNALYAIAIVNVPFFARNIRGLTVGLARRDFVDAARLSGKSNLRIIVSEVLPNVLPTIVITLSTTIGWMILETAGLSFLGLGAQPPQADLGSMLGEGRKVLFTAPFVSLVPGLMIFLIVLSINLLGDGIRDVLDPRLKSGALARPSARTSVDSRPRTANPDRGGSGVLDVENLQTEFSVGRSVHRAVGGVDLTIAAGECLGLIGESGSGKSVTAMSLTGLVPSPPGHIVGGRVGFEGEDLLHVSDARLRALRGGAIAYVFQDPLATLHPLMTAGDQLVEAIRAHQAVTASEARTRAVALMRQVRIPNPETRMHAYPHELSGGLRQRVSIAMALANDPKLIVADEPTTALDVTVQAQVLKLLGDLRRERGTAVLFITHDFGVISEIADRVAVMYAGRIVETGPTAEVMADPAHPYTRMLVDCVPVMGEPDRRLAAIRGRPPAVDRLPDGCAFADRCPRAKTDCRRGEIPMRSKRGAIEARCLHPLTPGERLETHA
ncbi:dipeptide/oligopeptide/nickel ABC transporter permease/ATP-binding protein [Fulvimarina sp. 2208YS6-2-32]|uniref:Dipeptide/oligopeptide/nickel ABC transporter permease/ATP-binding protein n=1 Tax=Fulvimarina uroteuthidis TaxID=3098149 RepID=A0ABU5I6W5_9HYPH|nr:dipeptide/oligopeptide/nickel ABC transporter permease/ATP-binding protein [Fulvimarina sp. 2208YS6-2-32]MDY8110559.1 dipeptide/oligopeptide/nickel ABC transporter permease/ATP-binding protein [Fulvimarina sp. 2208YS6-2-32]